MKKKQATVVTVGRNRGNSLVFDADVVSDRHAQIVIQEDFYFIKDLNSVHGTWVNGKPVKMVQLKDGDVLSFGSNAFSFVFCLEDDEPLQLAVSSETEAEDKIDLAKLPATKKIDWKKQLAVSPPSNVIPFVNEPERDIRSSAPDIRKKSLLETKADNRVEQPLPLPTIHEKQEFLIEVSGYRLLQIAVIAFLVWLMFFLNSLRVEKHAYDAGFKCGLKEFANPPRDLNRAIINKFAEPAAFQMEIKESNYTDFFNGVKDASYKTYVARFHSPPHLK
ncbi:MAG: FHA domain-containing protein [Chthoniobacteraceae bacterium]